MTRRLELCSLLALIVGTGCFGQDVSMLNYFSIQGNWDQEKNPQKSQFATDNRLLSRYFSGSEIEITRGLRDEFYKQNKKSISGIGEISFVVTEAGAIDQVRVIKPNLCDEITIKILKSTVGKWKVGQVDGIKHSDTLTLWYSFFAGSPYKDKKTLVEYLAESKTLVASNEFKKAVDVLERVLKYDQLNTEGILLMAKALAEQGKKQAACELIKTNLKYNYKKFGQAQITYCE